MGRLAMLNITQKITLIVLHEIKYQLNYILMQVTDFPTFIAHYVCKNNCAKWAMKND